MAPDPLNEITAPETNSLGAGIIILMATKVRPPRLMGDMTMRSGGSSERWNVSIPRPSNGVRRRRRAGVSADTTGLPPLEFTRAAYPLL
ncbi:MULTISPECIES: hypothetical protein [Phyllobacterium]|uniref:Uncharacterized protein n=1 Tax=Phyllobacterium sophorae TaxID=1520277 RepID=A0A2P7AT02_9HYPH|nr:MULTISPECIES: hypothetical protein [Phyllobacterium]PSH57317.1 hypothetical protein CU103_28570 [Phyllobacterium sophorae]UXN65713.1 hypothetical protein N8E89_09050 [Phyllobacterium sp. A18/5-2]